MGIWKSRIGYGVAELAGNLLFQMMSSYLMIFYTDVFGIGVLVAGSIIMVTRFIDAITDVAMGMIVDRTNTKWGKSRPYFLFGAIPFGLISVATFTVPALGENDKIIYAFVTYIALSCAYTVVNIPLTTILPSLTSDAQERTILVTVRMICSMIGATIVTTFTTPLVDFFGAADQARGYFITILIYAIVAVGLFFFTFKNTEEKVRVAVQNGEKRDMKGDFQAFQPQCIIFILMSFFYFAVFAFRSTAIVYYFKYNLMREDLVPMIGVLGTLSGLPVLLVLPYITGKLGKRNSVITGAVIYIVGTLLMFIGVNSIPAIMIGLVATGCGMYLMQGTVFAISPDAIDYCEYKSGRSIAGMVTAIQGFSVKLSIGVSGFIVGKILDATGYVENQAQTAQALMGIRISFLWIPIVISLIVIAMSMIYKLDRQMPDIQTELARQREQQ